MQSSLALIFSIMLLSACASPPKVAPGGLVKTAPSSGTPRLIDCAGENQTSKGNTRADCLPNKGDEAARDTAAGAGSTELLP